MHAGSFISFPRWTAMHYHIVGSLQTRSHGPPWERDRRLVETQRLWQRWVTPSLRLTQSLPFHGAG